LYFWGECPKSGGGFQPPRSGWKPLPLCAAKLREGHAIKVRPKGDKFYPKRDLQNLTLLVFVHEPV